MLVCLQAHARRVPACSSYDLTRAPRRGVQAGAQCSSFRHFLEDSASHPTLLDTQKFIATQGNKLAHTYTCEVQPPPQPPPLLLFASGVSEGNHTEGLGAHPQTSWQAELLDLKLQPLLTVEIDPTAELDGDAGGRLCVRVVNTQWTGNMSDELLGTDMTTCNTLRWREVRRFCFGFDGGIGDSGR